MTEAFGSLAFLITLDLAMGISLAVSWRLMRFDFLLYGLIMMAFETARQILSVVIFARSDVALLLAGSSVLDFGCALALWFTAGAMVERRVRPLWCVPVVVLYLVLLPMSYLPGLHSIAAWTIGSFASLSLSAASMLVLVRGSKRSSFGVLWMIGLISLSMCFRVLLPFALEMSDSVFGAMYLLDSIVVSIIGAAIGVYSVERLARDYRIEKERTQESTELIRTALDHAYDAVIVTDESGVVKLWSRSAEVTFGWPVHEAVERNIGELIPGINRANRSDDGVQGRVASRSRSGEPFVVEGVTFTVDRDGERRVVRILRDVTEQVKSDTELRTLEEQVRHVQRLESLGVFAGGVAHDYNNILSAIMSFADLGLQDAAAGSPVETCLREIVDAAGRGSDLTRQILEYAGRYPANASTIDVAAEIESIVPLLKSVISKKATLTTAVAPGTVRLRADRSQLGQVLLNLVSNASDALDDCAGRITIRVDTVNVDSADLSGYLFGAEIVPGEFIRVLVTDTGAGMSADALSKVFDPFYTTKPAGRGLGMATVSAIVRAHGGAIKVESQIDAGTTVTVLLPPGVAPRPGESAAPVAAQDAAARDTAADAAQDVASIRGTVLVVDDEEAVRTAVGLILKRAGFAVLTAADGFECLELLARRDGDVGLVVLDCNMPRMGGEEALDEILRRDAGLPVLLSSGKSRRINDADARPNVQFIQKPYRATDLITKVTAMMGN